MIYRTCEECGANLDPGEVCDCKKAAPGVTSTQSGESGKGYQPFNSAPTVSDTEGKSNG